MLGDPAFHKVLFNSLLFVAANVVAQLGIGLAVALFFSQRFPGVHFLRGLLLAAWMLPALVVGALWKWLFATQYGVVNFVLRGCVRAGALAGRSVAVAHLGHHRQYLVRHAVQHDPDIRGADRHPAGALRGRLARWRRPVPALPLHHAAGTAAGAARHRLPDHDLHHAGIRSDLRHDGGGPLDSSNVLPLFSYQFTFQQFRFGIGAAIGTFAFIIVFAVALLYMHTLRREAVE